MMYVYKLIIFIICINYSLSSLKPLSSSSSSSKCFVRYLESNSWDIKLDEIRILLDPVLIGALDFGIPLLYKGERLLIDGKQELQELSKLTDYVLITQGFDDHAHTPTLKKLSSLCPNMPYICPPSAKSILEKCGIQSNLIQTILPGETLQIRKKNTVIDIIATTGALLGPPWQQKENGYILKPQSKSIPSLYMEPHCMYDADELAKYSVDYVITPIVSQELPAYTLVDGGAKALNLAETLSAKSIIPMNNGGLDQSGILSALVEAKGSDEEFRSLAKNARKAIQVETVVPGKPLSVEAKSSTGSILSSGFFK